MSIATWIYVGIIVLQLTVVFPLLFRTRKTLRRTWRKQAGTWRTMARTARLGGRTSQAEHYEQRAIECDRRTRHWWTA